MADASERSALAYYASHAPMSDLGEYAYVAHSDAIADLVARVQGLVMHPFHASRYGVSLAEDSERQLQNRSAREMLAEVLAIDAAPLSSTRAPDKRTFGNCRHFATLFTALLRERGIPARSRCGFGAYFPALPGQEGRKIDHWVSEVWNAADGRWQLVDPQIDDVQREQLNISCDTLDLDREDFWVAGQAWLRCRNGQEEPEHFGILDMWGSWFVRDNLLRDVAALCKVELLPWDAWGQMLSATVDELDEAGLALLDRMAELTTAPVPDVAEIRALYQKHDELRVPPTIMSFRPEPGPVEIGELCRGG
jgi:hypothetical protein